MPKYDYTALDQCITQQGYWFCQVNQHKILPCTCPNSVTWHQASVTLSKIIGSGRLASVKNQGNLCMPKFDCTELGQCYTQQGYWFRQVIQHKISTCACRNSITQHLASATLSKVIGSGRLASIKNQGNLCMPKFDYTTLGQCHTHQVYWFRQVSQHKILTCACPNSITRHQASVALSKVVGSGRLASIKY